MYIFRKSKKGFTLIELMVVVAIIGVLALLGLRLYSGQQNKAKNAIVKANAGTIQTLIQAELADSPTDEVWDNVAAAADGGTLGPGGTWNLLQSSGIQNPLTNEAQDANGTEGGNACEVYVVAYDIDDAVATDDTIVYFEINGNDIDSNPVYDTDLTARR